jgi:hypothetical protein
MNSDRLLDRVRWGYNRAARAIGASATAYRPRGIWNPLDSANRYLRLPAAFTPVTGRFARPNEYGAALWVGLYDASYTQPGDYLVLESGTWFIAAQDRFLPSLCVETNRTVSLLRPNTASATGANTYGGVTATTTEVLTGPWPASVLGISDSGRQAADLPTDVPAAYWTVLLPSTWTVIPQPSDLVADDIGRSGVVATAEQSRLGWRLIVKEAST